MRHLSSKSQKIKYADFQNIRKEKESSREIWEQNVGSPEVKRFYVPPARKLVFSLHLRVAQCCVLRYRGMKCKNWIAHVPIAIQRSTIFFLFFFFFVQR